MPTIGKNDHEIADCLDELIDKLDDLIAATPQINVAVPEAPAPTVKIEAPARLRVKTFKVVRDQQGFVSEVQPIYED
jgi:hypothetical protein